MHRCIPQEWHNTASLSNYFVLTMIWDALILILHTMRTGSLCIFLFHHCYKERFHGDTYRSFTDPKQLLLLLFWLCYTSCLCVCVWDHSMLFKQVFSDKVSYWQQFWMRSNQWFIGKKKWEVGQGVICLNLLWAEIF